MSSSADRKNVFPFHYLDYPSIFDLSTVLRSTHFLIPIAAILIFLILFVLLSIGLVLYYNFYVASEPYARERTALKKVKGWILNVSNLKGRKLFPETNHSLHSRELHSSHTENPNSSTIPTHCNNPSTTRQNQNNPSGLRTGDENEAEESVNNRRDKIDPDQQNLQKEKNEGITELLAKKTEKEEVELIVKTILKDDKWSVAFDNIIGNTNNVFRNVQVLHSILIRPLDYSLTDLDEGDPEMQRDSGLLAVASRRREYLAREGVLPVPVGQNFVHKEKSLRDRQKREVYGGGRQQQQVHFTGTGEADKERLLSHTLRKYGTSFSVPGKNGARVVPGEEPPPPTNRRHGSPHDSNTGNQDATELILEPFECNLQFESEALLSYIQNLLGDSIADPLYFSRWN